MQVTECYWNGYRKFAIHQSKRYLLFLSYQSTQFLSKCPVLSHLLQNYSLAWPISRVKIVGEKLSVIAFTSLRLVGGRGRQNSLAKCRVCWQLKRLGQVVFGGPFFTLFVFCQSMSFGSFTYKKIGWLDDLEKLHFSRVLLFHVVMVVLHPEEFFSKLTQFIFFWWLYQELSWKPLAGSMSIMLGTNNSVPDHRNTYSPRNFSHFWCPSLHAGIWRLWEVLSVG